MQKKSVSYLTARQKHKYIIVGTFSYTMWLSPSCAYCVVYVIYVCILQLISNLVRATLGLWTGERNKDVLGKCVIVCLYCRCGVSIYSHTHVMLNDTNTQMQSPPNPCHKKPQPHRFLTDGLVFAANWDLTIRAKGWPGCKDSIRSGWPKSRPNYYVFVSYYGQLAYWRGGMYSVCYVLGRGYREPGTMGCWAHEDWPTPKINITLHTHIHSTEKSRIQIQQFIFRYTFMDTNILDAHHVWKLPINELFFAVSGRGSVKVRIGGHFTYVSGEWVYTLYRWCFLRELQHVEVVPTLWQKTFNLIETQTLYIIVKRVIHII